jgi:hypothetical protein
MAIENVRLLEQGVSMITQSELARAAAAVREVDLTTFGRQTGRPGSDVTIPGSLHPRADMIAVLAPRGPQLPG